MFTIERHLIPDRALAEEIERREEELRELRERLAAWREKCEAIGERDTVFTSISDREILPVYTPVDRAGADPYLEALSLPGEYPFTRGPYATMYRTRLWTKRQFAGFADAEETNARYKYLLAHRQTGLSVAFDFPTLMGYDSDHQRALGEVGVCGVAISSLADMETLFDGIPLDEVSVSMTINGPAAILFAFYVAAAEKQGIGPDRILGTVQNDILKEYQAQHAWVYPPGPALRLIVDMFDWTSVQAPKYNPISISGYHIREAGATAAQELAFTLKNGFEYVERGIARGLEVDRFAPRLSFFFDVHNDFFEEVAKLRAARRIWARHMRERYGATNPEVVAAAHTRADGRGEPDRAATREQHRPGGLPGHGRGAGRHAVAAHQLDGRDPRSPDGECGANRAPHAADPGLRDGRSDHDRSARGLLLRGDPDRPARGRGGGDLSPGGRDRRRGDRHRGRLIPAADRQLGAAAATQGRVRTAGDRGGERVHGRIAGD